MGDGPALEVPTTVATDQTVALHVTGVAAEATVEWQATPAGAGDASVALAPAGRAALFTPDAPGLWTVTATVDGQTPQVLDAAVVVRAVTPRIVGKPDALPFEPTVLDGATSDGPEGHGYRWTLEPPGGGGPLAVTDAAVTARFRAHGADTGTLRLVPRTDVGDAEDWTVRLALTLPSARTGAHEPVGTPAAHTLTIAPADPEVVPDETAIAAAKADVAELAATATKWEAGLMTTVGLAAAVAIVGAPDAVDDLSALGILLALTAGTLAFLSASLGLADFAAVGRNVPRQVRNQPEDVLAAWRQAVPAAIAALARGQRHVQTAAVVLAVGSIATILSATVASPTPPTSVSVVTVVDGSLRCDTLTGESSLVAVGGGAATTPVVVDECPAVADEDGADESPGSRLAMLTSPSTAQTGWALLAMVAAAVLARRLRAPWWPGALVGFGVLGVLLGIATQQPLLTLVVLASALGWGVISWGEVGWPPPWATPAATST